jgi:predicted nucleic acid-binding protein
VALFDPRDPDHLRCREQLAGVHERVVTTSPVLTEAFYFLEGTRGGAALRQFVRDSGVSLWTLDDERLRRCLDLMDEYEDHPMGLADASLVAAAETLRVTTAWTLDRADFVTYRPRIGRKLSRFKLL